MNYTIYNSNPQKGKDSFFFVELKKALMAWFSVSCALNGDYTFSLFHLIHSTVPEQQHSLRPTDALSDNSLKRIWNKTSPFPPTHFKVTHCQKMYPVSTIIYFKPYFYKNYMFHLQHKFMA